jgi:hypothetical protein
MINKYLVQQDGQQYNPTHLVISSSTSTHDIKLVTDVVDNVVIKQRLLRQQSSHKPKLRRRRLQRPYLDKAYNSEPEEQVLIKRVYVLHISPKRKRGEEEVQVTTQPCLNRKKHSPKRWVVYRKDNLMAQQVSKTVYRI